MSIRIISIAAFTLCLTVLVGVLATRDEPRTVAAPPASATGATSASSLPTQVPDTSETLQLRRELEVLRETVQSLHEAVQTLQTDRLAMREEVDALDLSIATAEATMPRAEDSTPEGVELPDEREWLRAESERLEDRLALASPDPDWADYATREVERGLDEYEFEGTRILDSECGDELCRIEFSSEDPFEMMQVIDALPVLIPSLGSSWWFGDEETGRLTVFSERSDGSEG